METVQEHEKECVCRKRKEDQKEGKVYPTFEVRLLVITFSSLLLFSDL